VSEPGQATPVPAAPTPAPAAPQGTAMLAPTPTPPPASGVYIPPGDTLVGTTIVDRYHVERKLGEGGMGSVYLATHITLEKAVALKVLHGEFSRRADLVERFLQEARSASRIRHENVIDITDFGTTPDGLVFFAMEFLKGHDLHEEVARAKLAGRVLPWSRTSKIFLQICAALSAAHARGIVHRDLKPENIYLVEWLGHSDFVKLLDFGIAKMTEVNEEGRKLTRTGMLFGTPEYMSPEQAKGEKVDHRVDVYAMGCILQQLVTGRVPFEADNFMGILSMHLSEEPPPITDEQLEDAGAPVGIRAVVAKALAKDPDARFQSIDELAQAVLAAEAGEVMPFMVEPSPGGRVRTQWTGNVKLPDRPAAPVAGPARKSPLPWIAAGLGALGVAGALVLALGRGGGAGEATDPAGATDPGGVTPLPALVTLSFDSRPPGAAIIDQETGQSLGTTPLDYTMPASRDTRRFRFVLAGHQDRLVELVPAADIDHAVTLRPLAVGAPAIEPEVEVVPAKRPRPPRPDRPTPVKPDPIKPVPEVKPDPIKPDPEVKPPEKKPDPALKPPEKKPDPEVKPPEKKPGVGDPELKDPFAL
jgi:eukaryotic-like serine/threonine-protein kinase